MVPLALLLLFCTLGGCGRAGAVRPTLKIGLVAPFEGRYRSIGYDVIYAARLAVREANAAGGVAGYSVELVAYDDGGVPDTAALQARKLDADPLVLGVIGHFRESTTAASLPGYAEAELPIVAPDVYAVDLTSGPADLFRLAPRGLLLAGGILDRVESLGADRAALVTVGGPLGTALTEVSADRAVALVPIVSALEAGWELAVLEENPMAAVIDAEPVTSGEAAASLREAGWQGEIVGGPALAASDFRAVAGTAARGHCVTPWPLPEEVADGAAFAEAYRRVSQGLPPGRLALPAYEATWILIEAIELDLRRHGSASREGVAQALASTLRRGLLGTITFGDDGSWDSAPLYLCEAEPSGTE